MAHESQIALDHALRWLVAPLQRSNHPLSPPSAMTATPCSSLLRVTGRDKVRKLYCVVVDVVVHAVVASCSSSLGGSQAVQLLCIALSIGCSSLMSVSRRFGVGRSAVVSGAGIPDEIPIAFSNSVCFFLLLIFFFLLLLLGVIIPRNDVARRLQYIPQIEAAALCCVAASETASHFVVGDVNGRVMVWRCSPFVRQAPSALASFSRTAPPVLPTPSYDGQWLLLLLLLLLLVVSITRVN